MRKIIVFGDSTTAEYTEERACGRNCFIKYSYEKVFGEGMREVAVDNMVRRAMELL